jgi:hypothetical protein
MSQSSTQTSYLTTEINTWKNKFIELNREFHSTQEAFMLCQAELENLKKGGLKVEKVTTELRSVHTQPQTLSRRNGVQLAYEIRATNASPTTGQIASEQQH